MVNFLYLFMTSFFQAFFSLVRHVPCALFIVFPCQTLVDLIYTQFVLEFPIKLSGNFFSSPDCRNVMFCLSRFSCLTDHSLWTACQ